MVCMAKKVLGPTEHPKSAMAIVFEGWMSIFSMSRLLVIAEIITFFAASNPSLCNGNKLMSWERKKNVGMEEGIYSLRANIIVPKLLS